MISKNNKNWLQKMPRKELNAYIRKVDALHSRALLEGDEHNEQIYGLWLAEATMEVKRRDNLREFYINNILKKDSRF